MQPPWKMTDEVLEYIQANYPVEEQARIIRNYKLFYLDSYKVPSFCGFAIIGAYGGIVLLVGLLHFLSYLSRKMLKSRDPSRSAATVWYKTHILEAPFLWNNRRAAAHEWFHGTFVVRAPGRIHMLALMATLVANLVCCFAFYHGLPADVRSSAVLGTVFQQHARSFADRAALLAMAQLPIVFFFAGHNSLVLLLTRCSFSTIMLYHRWLARLVTLLVLGHAIGYTIVYVEESYYSQVFSDLWWRWGIVSFSMMVVACFFAYTVFRRFSYEIFLLFHIIFVAWAMIGLWKHIALLEETTQTPYLIYMWVSIIFWAGDRLLRFTWTLIYSINWRNLVNGKQVLTRSVVRAVPDGTLIVRIRPAGYTSGWLHPRAGQHIMVNIPHVQQFTMHPYSVMASGVDDHAENPIWYDVAIKPMNGFSRHLAQRHAQAGGDGRDVVTFIEGPYGKAIHTDGYGSIILVSAGIGVTHTVSVLLDTLKVISSSPCKLGDQEAGSALKQRIDFVWVCRSPGAIPLLVPYLVAAAKQLTAHGRLDVHIHVFLSDGASHLDLQSQAGDVTGTKTPDEAQGIDEAQSPGSPGSHSCGTPDEKAVHTPPLAEETNPDGVQALSYSTSGTRHGPGKSVLSDLVGAEHSAYILEAGIDKWLQEHDPNSTSFVEDLKAIRHAMFISLHLGRADFGCVLRQAIGASPPMKQGRTSTLVTSCGPETFCDEVRDCIRKTRTVADGIDLDEEVYAW